MVTVISSITACVMSIKKSRSIVFKREVLKGFDWVEDDKHGSIWVGRKTQVNFKFETSWIFSLTKACCKYRESNKESWLI